jgi:ATP-dependent Lon protease
MATRRIPLFPLGLVLFPGRNLPLHIFEERYKLMITRCTQAQAPFGIVLASGEGIATIGCTANILQIVKTYEDGRMDIVTSGESAYRIHELHNDEPYLEGDVEMLADDSQSGSPAAEKELRDLFEKCYRLFSDGALPPTEDDPNVSLAYQVAADLPLDLDVRQAVLEVRAEADRRQLLIERLSEILPELERIQKARSKVSGNGHAPR